MKKSGIMTYFSHLYMMYMATDIIDSFITPSLSSLFSADSYLFQARLPLQIQDG